MARLQDFQTVTPTSSDKFLVVQSTGQGLVAQTSKMDSANPTGTGKFSLNRASGSVEGTQSFAEGRDCVASGSYAHAEGDRTQATSSRTHSEGETTQATAEAAHAEGYGSIASGTFSHAEGRQTTASGNNGSHAEGYSTTANASGSHAEGNSTTASGNYSHAEGQSNTASGGQAHVEGYSNTASGAVSHAEGRSTIANHWAQHVFGAYNIADTSTAEPTNKGNYVEIVGNGTGDATANRSNARTLDWDGNETLAGGLKVNGSNDVQPMVALAGTSGASTTTYTIPSEIYATGGVYILAFRNNYAVGGVYLLQVRSSGGSQSVVVNAIKTSSYITVEGVAANQFKVTTTGETFTPALTRLA